MILTSDRPVHAFVMISASISYQTSIQFSCDPLYIYIL